MSWIRFDDIFGQCPVQRGANKRLGPVSLDTRNDVGDIIKHCDDVAPVQCRHIFVAESAFDVSPVHIDVSLPGLFVDLGMTLNPTAKEQVERDACISWRTLLRKPITLVLLGFNTKLRCRIDGLS